MIAKNNRGGWNRNLAIGQKRAFSLEEVIQLEQLLLAEENWHDLALLSFGLDTMFRAGDLLATKMEQITYPNGNVRTLIPRVQQKTQHAVFPVLTGQARHYVQIWLEVGSKQSHHFVFTRNKATDAGPISRSHYADVIKGWAEMLGLDPSDYSTHSIRRSKPTHMFWRGVDVPIISKLLGHKSTAVTLDYLSITQQKAEKAALAHSMLAGASQRKRR